MPAAWNAHDTRQMSGTNCSITHHLLAYGSRGRAARTQSRRSTRLQEAAACGSGKTACQTCQPPAKIGLEVAESLPAGSGEDWLCWRALNRLRIGVGRAETGMRRWDYLDDAQSVDCNCVEHHTMAHLLSCRLLDEACMADDLALAHARTSARTH